MKIGGVARGGRPIVSVAPAGYWLVRELRDREGNEAPVSTLLALDMHPVDRRLVVGELAALGLVTFEPIADDDSRLCTAGGKSLQLHQSGLPGITTGDGTKSQRRQWIVRLMPKAEDVRVIPRSRHASTRRAASS